MITQMHTGHNPLVLLHITLKAALHSEKRYLSVTAHFPVNPVSSAFTGLWTVWLNLDLLLLAESQPCIYRLILNPLY